MLQNQSPLPVQILRIRFTGFSTIVGEHPAWKLLTPSDLPDESRVGRHLRTTHHRDPRLRLTELIHEHQDAEAQRLPLTTPMTGTETK